MNTCCLLDEPGPPGKPEVLDRDRTFIEIKWAEPLKDGGAPITGYDIERKEPKTNRWTKLNKSPVRVRLMVLFEEDHLIIIEAFVFTCLPVNTVVMRLLPH